MEERDRFNGCNEIVSKSGNWKEWLNYNTNGDQQGGSIKTGKN